MKYISVLIIFISMIFSALVSASVPIQNIIDFPVPINLDGSSPNIEQVQMAIISGCKKRGWTPVFMEGNRIKASILVRATHYVEVEIPFSSKSYSIIYVSSRELDYNEKKNKIHKSYNKWVSMLSNSIQRGFSVRSQMY